MSIHGYVVGLSSSSYEAPRCCSSCMGPRETQVVARVSEKSGNIRTTLKMEFLYCNACAKRAHWQNVRKVLIGCLAAVLGVGLAVGAWVLDVGVDTAILFAVALPASAGLAVGLALITRGSVPPAPATARGEAVILQDTSGTVLCTNLRFAQLLAEANGTKVKPGAQHMTVEVLAPLMALLCGVLVLLAWAKEGEAHGSKGASKSAGTSSSAPTTGASTTLAAASVNSPSGKAASAGPASADRPSTATTTSITLLVLARP